MLIELIRVAEFIVTCLILFALIVGCARLYQRHNRIEAKKKEILREQHYRQMHGPHGSSATIKGAREKRQKEEWKL